MSAYNSSFCYEKVFDERFSAAENDWSRNRNGFISKGITTFQIFKKCNVHQNNNDNAWFFSSSDCIEIAGILIGRNRKSLQKFDRYFTEFNSYKWDLIPNTESKIILFEGEI